MGLSLDEFLQRRNTYEGRGYRAAWLNDCRNQERLGRRSELYIARLRGFQYRFHDPPFTRQRNLYPKTERRFERFSREIPANERLADDLYDQRVPNETEDQSSPRVSLCEEAHVERDESRGASLPIFRWQETSEPPVF